MVLHRVTSFFVGWVILRRRVASFFVGWVSLLRRVTLFFVGWVASLQGHFHLRRVVAFLLVSS